ncbi:putative DNA-binding transcriptional regulator [Corynebacterium cystitidis DSM 20524]|uniref:HipA-like C-terminal domain-containing protein n=2 Tax=Corynebacterium cystitidis TaxID=35757 RepID=A0A1H9R182_9CORY|nr:putative DNA-binding transcriptional regulator [Corynebacterium cystitidis DSM 20524]SER65723.1 HipA-like C-terminal domain-containing protein [Corynebacterium cystitidis DSM 20524]SNV85707.1 putative DNA-binding transcriptional regulator [Corynebacterium cystitidis]
MNWEYHALESYRLAGARVAEAQTITVGDTTVLVLQRFDRGQHGQRISFISAMTATGKRDGEAADYLDIVDAIRHISGDIEGDLEELFRRATLNVVLGNTDDHLRNHAFLSRKEHWFLSPAFDVNPNPQLHARRATSIVGAAQFPEEVHALHPLAEECGLTTLRAKQIVEEIIAAAEHWELESVEQ